MCQENPVVRVPGCLSQQKRVEKPSDKFFFPFAAIVVRYSLVCGSLSFKTPFSHGSPTKR